MKNGSNISAQTALRSGSPAISSNGMLCTSFSANKRGAIIFYDGKFWLVDHYNDFIATSDVFTLKAMRHNVLRVYVRFFAEQ